MMQLARYADSQIIDIPELRQTLSLLNDKPAFAKVKCYKQALKDMDDCFHERFDHHDDIRDLIYGRAWGMDQLLALIWSQYEWQNEADIALIAVGGYGRAELLPKSDIDLLLLFANETAIESNKENIETLLTLLWDLGLDIGSSIRTMDDCLTEAQKDITITTNLLETRTITGNDELCQAMTNRIMQDDVWNSEAFFKAKLNEQAIRYDKFDETEYNLEPNVKSSPGALRDIQNVGWVAKRHFGDSSLNDLANRGFLLADELLTINKSQEFLWQVRYALHKISGREEDRLLFDLQNEVASHFGFRDNKKYLAIEQLMHKYYRNVLRLRELNDMLLQHFSQEIIEKNKLQVVTPINKRFQIINDNIDVTHDDVFTQKPSALLEIFLLLAENPKIKGIRAHTSRLIRSNRHLIDANFRQDIRNISYFNELLRSPNGVSTNLRRMARYGILGRYLPEFGRVTGQMQYDLFHIYTVDAHTLLCIRNLRKFRHESNTEKFPIATQVIQHIPKVELLYIAALYHDIGKGQGGDHSLLGAQDAQRFCERHRLNKWDTDLVIWLVENHLLMSLTSQRKDLSDPDVILEFAQKVGDQTRLGYLYVLTVADISATNPSLWNSWRASLLKRLYTEAKRMLRRGLENSIDKDDLIEETKQKAISILVEDGFTEDNILEFWESPGDDYFLRESPENIAWHFKSINSNGLGAPLVLIKETHEKRYEGGTQIFIYAPDRPHLFADIASTLGNLNLSIQDARIMTSSASNFSLDTFTVINEDGKSIGDDPDRIRNIQYKLLLAIESLDDVKETGRLIPRQMKHFDIPCKVAISNDINNHHTIVEVLASDRPGLLAKISQTFKSFNLQMQNARILTLGERVEDVFFIVDAQNKPISDPALCDELRIAIETALTN